MWIERKPVMHSAKAHTTEADRGFSISSRRLEDGILVALRGDVDLASAPIVEAELRRAEESESLVTLDLSQVSFMDSTGMRTVITADQRLQARGGSLRIIDVPPQVSRLFELVGILHHLTIDGRRNGEAA
jgi:anti-sigma B factor antagonist